MSEVAVEAIILAINALGCGILLFVSSVVQKMMNGMEPLEFKKFANVFGRTAMSDPLAVTIATIPMFAVIYYFAAFGFNHWWFTAGIAAWMIGSAITKVTNLPIYQWVGAAGECRPRAATEEASHARAGERVARVADASFCRHDGMPAQHRRNRDCRRRVRHHRLPVALVSTQVHTEWLASLENKRAIQSGTTFLPRSDECICGKSEA